MRLSDKIEQKRSYTDQGTRQVILLHDKARPHSAIATKELIYTFWAGKFFIMRLILQIWRIQISLQIATSFVLYSIISFYALSNTRRSRKFHNRIYWIKITIILPNRDSPAARETAKMCWKWWRLFLSLTRALGFYK